MPTLRPLRLASLVVLTAGLVLLVLGLNSGDFATGGTDIWAEMEADRGVWLTALGVAATVVGGLTFLFQRHS
jgi:hypothetical protein